MKLSFYTPIAYDYQYAFSSILSYYDIADEIILAIDKDRISWANKPYTFDNDVFWSWIKNNDRCHKIKVVEDNFHCKSNPTENDTYERNYISSLCTGYIIGIDSDEILLNPIEFKRWLIEKQPTEDVTCTWFSVYKSFGDKLLITLPNEEAGLGTALKNKYYKCRCTKNPHILSPLKVLHFSWGRTRDEIIQKLNNWTHTYDFNIEKHLQVWDSVTLENYKEKTNLHPLGLKQWWKSLECVDLNHFQFHKNEDVLRHLK